MTRRAGRSRGRTARSSRSAAQTVGAAPLGRYPTLRSYAGCIAVYNLASALRDPSTRRSPAIASSIRLTEYVTAPLPTHYLSVHQSAIRALAWVGAPPAHVDGTPALDRDPTVLASGGYDGTAALTDIRDGAPHVMNRTRGTWRILLWSPIMPELTNGHRRDSRAGVCALDRRARDGRPRKHRQGVRGLAGDAWPRAHAHRSGRPALGT
jgi:hypothetical protein